MPPRFVYWTILIDGKPTAFRARDQQELLPTFNQLKRTNQDVVIKWFARGQLWDSPEAERRPRVTGEKRTKDWRPGGAHKDPRDRFKKKNRPERAWSDSDRPARRDRDTLGPPPESRPWRDKPAGPPRGRPLGASKPYGGPKPFGGKALDSSKPYGGRKPFGGGKPRHDRPWSGKPPSDGGTRPWNNKPRGPAQPRSGKPRDRSRPLGVKPSGPARPWSGKPGNAPKPWHDRPRDLNRKPFVPRAKAPRRTRRGDEPDND